MAGDISGSYLRRMRTGQHPHVIVTLGNEGDGFNVAVVLLSSDDMLDINEQVDKRYAPKYDKEGKAIPNPVGTQNNRSRFYNRLLCYHAMRLPEDLEIRVADSPDEVGELLDDEDIKRVCEKYNELLVNKAPKLEVIKKEELEELKKYLEVTPLNAINTVSLVHLKYCHQTLTSEGYLTSNGFGSLSIKK